MELRVFEQELSICKVREVPRAVYGTGLYFIGKTDEELSLACETAVAPERGEALAREDGWRALRIEGVLDFSLTGVLAGLSAALADAGIGIFAVSTYNTDYILVKGDDLARALDALAAAGHTVVAGPGGIGEARGQGAS